MPAFEPLGPGDPLLIGGYRVLARAGERVYLCAAQSGRRLAVTLVDPDETFRERVAAAQRVRSPFVAHVLDAHPSSPLPWMATEHVPGPSLATATAKLGPLPPAAARLLFGSLAKAIEAAHAAGVPRVALTPSTVILGPDGPRVLAPGVHTAGPADVQALGALISESTDCPPELRPLVERCLSGDPDERPPLAEILAALEPGDERPGEGWLPASFAALLPAYAAEEPHRTPPPLPEPAPAPALRPAPGSEWPPPS
jgi:serine/threonine protein kinase